MARSSCGALITWGAGKEAGSVAVAAPQWLLVHASIKKELDNRLAIYWAGDGHLAKTPTVVTQRRRHAHWS
jgi:hypothetical protein